MDMEAIRRFKKKVGQQGVIGPFSKTHDAAWIEIMGYAGFDFVIIDLEHGPNHMLALQNLVRAAELAQIMPIVRIKENMPSLIGEVLDAGAGGIQVPKITCAAEARTVVEYAKFHPEGSRGVCRYVRAAGYSALDKFKYFTEANEALVILQVEGEEAVEKMDEILCVEGIDVIFIGPYDLSQSMGVPGQVDHPFVTGKMEEIVKKCSRHNTVVGTFVENTREAEKWRKLGIGYISFSVDVGIFYNACSQIVRDMKWKEERNCEI